MMTAVDEVYLSNWQSTGSNVPFPQYSFLLVIKWTDDAGQQHTYGPATHYFPNDMAGMPLHVRRMYAEDMILRTLRVTLGIDVWPED